MSRHCFPTSRGRLWVSNSLPKEERDPAGTVGISKGFACAPASSFLTLSCAKEEAQPQTLLQAAIIRKMHGASGEVLGAQMKEHRGSSRSTVGCADSESGAERERWHVLAGREHR